VWEQLFKNIREPIRVYKVLIEKNVDELILDKKLELLDKPSIAVLPFVNMSDDPGQEYFSDGLIEQIITSLSRIPNIFVIARNSTFAYKGKPVKVQRIAEDFLLRISLKNSTSSSLGRIIFKYLKTPVPDHL